MTTDTQTTNEVEIDEATAKINALAAFLECDADDISETRYDENTFDAEGGEYMVLTDEEADQRATEYIKDSLWAFNPSFLSGETDIDEDVFTAIASNDRCESNNDAILALIKGSCGIDAFVSSAISADGRGHFMSSYDGNENEQGEFFIYRTN